VKVLLTCPYAWDDAGGVQVHVRELSRRLDAAGHQVLVLAPARAGVRASETWFTPVGRPFDIPYNSSNAPIDPRPWSRRPIAALIAGFKPEVIHAHEPLTPSTSMWATMEAGEVPVVATFHSAARRSLAFDIAAPLLRRVARRLSGRIAVSDAAAEFARRRIGGAFDVIPNGVEVSRFQSAVAAQIGAKFDGGVKLLFVGRLDARKGFKTAVEAFRIASATRTDLQLIVAGDGPQKSAIESLPAALRGRVLMLGAVPNAEIPAYYAACDLYLGPAVGGESFGIVLLEAMAAGLPLVASDIPGYREVVTDGVQGLLVPAGDPSGYAEAIDRILGDPGLAGRLANGALARARGYDWSVVVPQIERIYRRVAGSLLA
jgi:phosphatidylinositol alpha-mannosyltransferase